jgi:hypothetical protein
VPSKGEGNEEQKQEGGSWHPQGEINQEQNQKRCCFKEDICGFLMYSPHVAVSGVFEFVYEILISFLVGFLCEELIVF